MSPFSVLSIPVIVVGVPPWLATSALKILRRYERQDLISKDNVWVKVDTVLCCHVVDPAESVIPKWHETFAVRTRA